MATLLCHIQINPGKEREFEAVMKEMYRRTHAEEPHCIRYEYFRGAAENSYYNLMSFTEGYNFLEHQVSDYHEGFDFASMIESLELEWVDPVGDASPLKPTEAAVVPDNASDEIKGAQEAFMINVQSWWQGHR